MTDLDADSESSSPTPSFWQWLRRNLWPSKTELYQQLQQRVAGLDDAIVIDPEAASNYVLRGEIYLQLEEFALARLDFERACERIAEQLETDRWGIVAQSLQDRAQRGLEIARKRLAQMPDQAVTEVPLTVEHNQAWDDSEQWAESEDQADFETDF